MNDFPYKEHSISIEVSWQAAVKIYLMVLEDGDEEGKTKAREDLLSMADKMDRLKQAYHIVKDVDRDDLQDCQDKVHELLDLFGIEPPCDTCGAPPGETHPPACADAIEAEQGPDVHEIYDDCITLMEDVMSRAKREANSKGWIVVSRGFEFLSLDANQERDENIIDYVEDDKLTPEVIQEFIDDCRKQGSSFLGIGWGVDQADDQEGYDCGDYSPMFDWDDLPNIDVR